MMSSPTVFAGQNAYTPFAVSSFSLTIPSTKGVGVSAVASYGSHDPFIEEVTVTFGFGEAITKSGKKLWSDITLVGTVLARLVTGKVSLNSMGGPIMMYQLTSKTSELGFTYFFGLMAMISVNLGLMNLLPIPVLDGGHLVFLGIEAVRRRPLTPKVRGALEQVGLFLLAALVLWAFWNDINRLVGS